jgi:iron complex outermembrane receptor protein
MKHLISFLLLSACALTVAAAPVKRQTVTFQGMVIDSTEQTPIVGALVYFPELKNGGITGENGQFSVRNLPVVKATVQVSYLGHQTIVREVDLRTAGPTVFRMAELSATLGEAVVKGISGNSLLKHVPAPVSMLSEHDLQMKASGNIIDAVASQPGLAQITTGSGISKPVIRGLGYNRVLVVDDGVRQEGQQWGDEHGIELDAGRVHSVRILKGPASLMYGSDAMAGIIVFEDAPVQPEGQTVLDVQTEYQTNNGLFGYSLHGAGNVNGLTWDLRGSQKMAHSYKNRYDGYVGNSGFQERALAGMAGLNKPWGYSHLKLSYYHLKPGIPEGERSDETGHFVKPAVIDGEEDETEMTRHDFKSYGPGLPYQRVEHWKATADNSVLWGKGRLNAIIAFQQNVRREYESPMMPNEADLHFLLSTVNYNVHYIVPDWRQWRVAAGVGGMYQQSKNKGDEYLVPAYHLLDAGLFATAGRHIGKWELSGGLRMDYRHMHGHQLIEDGNVRFPRFHRDFWGITGSLGGILHLSSHSHLHLNVARGFRAPNVSELGSNGVHEGTSRYETGDVALHSEHNWQCDAGLDYSSDRLSAQLTLFVNRIDNYIYSHRLQTPEGEPVLTEGEPTYRFTQRDACLWGGEASVDWHPFERLHIENAFSYVHATLFHQPRESHYLPLTPAPRWNAEVRYQLVRDGRKLNNAFAAVNMEYNFRQDNVHTVGGTETATPDYGLFGVSLSTDIMHRHHRVASLYLIGNNLLDKGYQSHLSHLKYTGYNVQNGRTGIHNMGRNFTVKLVFPVIL